MEEWMEWQVYNTASFSSKSPLQRDQMHSTDYTKYLVHVEVFNYQTFLQLLDLLFVRCLFNYLLPFHIRHHIQSFHSFCFLMVVLQHLIFPLIRDAEILGFSSKSNGISSWVDQLPFQSFAAYYPRNKKDNWWQALPIHSWSIYQSLILSRLAFPCNLAFLISV